MSEPQNLDNIINTKLSEIVTLIEKTNSNYYNFNKIKEDFIKSLHNNYEGPMNKCVECGADMGPSNPRQLCGKTYCLFN
ncbi:hypothetical protein crov416 [Cafeteria roenbergensis virus]|uniref:Uncharacterized protein n=1 Tax=Cafeteria roenbergensis virus (strain BV-PW1) TaxID=693272 RepID=E3T5I7_CROVB|nr:hypothetical protein crov416 [Cafeteria roenbergensis virus BV-PW1]ADO67450.1 hypothetical protein crov416 [Cafeteria roenbergensis virus BV-PW1]